MKNKLSEDNDWEHPVCEQVLKNVEFTDANFPTVDFVKYGHHHECVEHDCEVSEFVGWLAVTIIKGAIFFGVVVIESPHIV